MASDDIDEHVESLRSAATNGNWFEVFKMCVDKSELCTAQITRTGDTVLHKAASSGEVFIVRLMVSIFSNGEDKINGEGEKSASADENGDEKKRVLGAKNDKGNTPLHLAASASKGSFEMCKMLGKEEPTLITVRNKSGETPLFMAALHGNKEAFLWLHYNSPDQDSSTQYKNLDGDTILHCAIERGHIDVAVEIIYLYKEHVKNMAMMRNKNRLCLIHLLAATPSAFESTDLLDRSFLVRRLYHCFFRVKKKEQATTRAELEHLERESFFETVMFSIWLALSDAYDCCEERCPPVLFIIIKVLKYLLIILGLLLLAPLFGLTHLFLQAGNWFHGIRKLKEKHMWTLQILKELLRHTSEEDVTSKPYIEDNEEGSLIVDTPLMIAAKNGVIEMVKKILQKFPSKKDVVNEEGKNIVLLAAEKKQTKLYKMLFEDEFLQKSDFSQVDDDGNTALHLAAKLGVNQNWQATTMVEEFKWFEFVKGSVPYVLWERYNKEGKTAEEIFRDSYKELLTSDRKWLDQTSQTCSVASTLVAGMAFSNFAGENINTKNDSSLMALSLSLTSTISFLAILAFRSQSLSFWRYVPFILQTAIFCMFGSIVALWISLMIHGQSIAFCTIIGCPIAILTIVSLPIFIGPTLMAVLTDVPPPNRNTTSAIQYRRPKKKENGTGFDRNQEPNAWRNIRKPRARLSIKRSQSNGARVSK